MNLLTHLHDLRHMVFISNQISSHTQKKKTINLVSIQKRVIYRVESLKQSAQTLTNE